MKNKFLLFSLGFFVLLIFLVLPKGDVLAWSQTPNASTGDSMALSLAISTSTASASTTITSTGADTTVGGVGFVVGTNSGTYTATSSRYDNSYATGTDLSWEITTAGTGAASSTNVILSPGTLYYYKAYATNTVVGVGYGGTDNEKTLLTKPAAPATSTFRVASLEDRIKITWTAATGAEKTEIRYKEVNYPTSISDGEQAYWGAGTEVTLYNLPSEHTYYFRAWSSTSDGGYTQRSDSFGSISSKTTAVSSGGKSWISPTTYADSLVINQGVATTQTGEVVLTLKAANTSLMTICNRSDLLNCFLENYSTTKSWTLTEGDGVKTVYAKFVSSDGLNSDLVFDTITLKIPAPVVSAPVAPAPVEEVPAVSEAIVEETPPSPKATEGKAISEMTKEELAAKIAEILVQVQTLQAELTKLKKVVVFEVNLKYGSRGDDVVKLQGVLIEEGLLSEGLNTGWFGPATKTAVIKFQEKYTSEILTPNGLSKGTGFVGPSTRTKLNELSGK